MKNANANLMKEININNVRMVMKQVETASKPQLAASTGLSVVTVNSLIRDLLARGEIFEDQIVPSNGGRPALTYRYNYNFSHALVIYLKENNGQRVTSAAVINLANEVLHKEEQTMSSFAYESIYMLIDRLLSAYSNIKVIGIGIPGQVVNGTITVSSHQELTEWSIVEEINQRFGLPVMVENDVNAAIVGHDTNQEIQAEEECTTGIYFPRNYPPGMGIYLNGHLVKGKNGLAGEVKFLPLDVDWFAELNQNQFAEAAARIIQSVNAILAPDRIVLYQDILNMKTWEPFWKEYGRKYPTPHDPIIIFKETFQEDYEAGMRWLSLQQIDPSLTYADE